MEPLRFRILFFDDGSDNSQFNALPFQIEHTADNQDVIEKIKRGKRSAIPYGMLFILNKFLKSEEKLTLIKTILQIDRDIQIVLYQSNAETLPNDFKSYIDQRDNVLVLNPNLDDFSVLQLIKKLAKHWQLIRHSNQYNQILDKLIGPSEPSLEKSLSLLKATIDLTDSGILLLDFDGHVLSYNKKFLTMWGLDRPMVKKVDEVELLNLLSNKLLNPLAFLNFVKKIHKNHKEIAAESHQLRDGLVIECQAEPYRDDNDKIKGRLWIFKDITERIKKEHKLTYQATHDALTKLPNRTLLLDRLSQNIALAKRSNGMFAVLFIDLDRFKLINDSFTHAFGDQLLCAIVERISRFIRSGDTFSRYGGDEFVIVLSVKSHEAALTIAHKINDCFQTPFNIRDKNIIISASTGIAIYPHNGVTEMELINCADLAMYHAKERGGDQFRFYSSTLNEKLKSRLEMEAGLKNALNKNNFYLLYQPQFNSNKQMLHSAEALIRWHHPEQGDILPMDFIPIAELTGWIIPIGEWVVEESCRQHLSWLEKGLPPIQIALNVSIQQLRQFNFAERISAILSKYKVDPKYINLEITENTILVHYEVLDCIEELKARGFKIVIDDFGSAHSNSNYLRGINVDAIKIDPSYIKNISNKGEELAIKSIIDLAKSLNFDVMAEGVETESQVHFLQRQQCEYLQGYYFSKPLSHQKITELFMKSFNG